MSIYPFLRRTAVRPWKPISIGVISAIALSGLVATPALAAEGDPTQAQGELLSADLVSGDLAGAARSYASIPGGPSIDSDPLTVSALDGSIELVSGGLQLPLITDGTTPGLLDLGQAGALSSYAATPSNDSAIAASGLLGADGAIAFDEDEEPATASTSSLDVTALLDQLGVEGLTDEIVDELSIEIGALASRATSDGATTTDEYRVADLSLDLHSQLVGDLATDIRGSLDALETPLQTTLQGIVGADGALTEILDAVDVDLGLAQASLGTPTATVTVADLSTAVDTALGGAGAILVSDDQAVTIDLTNGDITVDLAQLVNPEGTGLNGLDPNTDLLTDETIALITDGVANALGKITTPLTNAIDGVIDDTTVEIDIPIELTTLGGLVDVAEGSITVSGSVEQISLGTAVVDIDLELLGSIPLDDLIAAVANDLVPAIVSPLGDALDEILSATATEATDAIADLAAELLSTLSPVLDDVVSEVATITINAQPTLLGEPADIDEPGAFTVRALSISLLPNVTDSSLATIDLASSTVLAQVDVPTIITDPEGPVNPGDTITVSGSGFTCGPITVTISDGDTLLDTFTPERTAEGTFSFEYTVPEDIDPTTLTIIATTPEGCDEGDDTEIVVVDPPTVVATPNPVEDGESLTITGSDFTCGPVTVTITGEDSVVLATIPNLAVTDGGFSTSYPVPAGTDPQTLTVTAVATGDCDDEASTQVEIDQPESLELTPAQVRIGDAIDIEGDGWAVGSDVTVTFSNAAGQVGQPVSITPGAGGTIDGSFTVPAGTAPGTLTGTATQDDDTSTDTVVVLVEPTVVVDPDPVDPGETITISGSGFLCGPVDVTISDGDTELLVIEDVPVAADGTWSTTFDVPADIDATSLTIAAVATGTCGDEDDTDVEIDQPETVTFTPGEVRGGDEVDIEGDGWDADGGPVTIVFEDAAGNQVGEPVVITPDDDGTIDGTFEVPAGTPAGVLTGTATQGDDETTDVVEVFGPVTVSVEPGSVRAGADVTVGGGGWLPSGGGVTVTFEDADGTVVGEPVVLTPGDDGTIDGDFTVPEGTDAGILTATAVQGDDEATDTLAIAEEPSVTVQPDTARPGDVVTVGGGGWLDGTPVTVVFTDEDGDEIGDELSLTPTGGVITGSSRCRPTSTPAP